MSKIKVVGAQRLLDRIGPRREIEDNFADPLSYLVVLADYGIELLQRSFVASGRRVWDVILLPTLFRQVLVCLDSIHVQVSVAVVRGAIPSLRGLFEAALAIEWILEKGKERWGTQFYVGELRQERAWNRAVQPGSPENQELLRQAPPGFADRFQDPERIAAARTRIQQIDETLEEDSQFREISDAFDAYKKKRNLRYEPVWYSPGGGPTSLRKLAEALNRLTDYDVLYAQWSEVQHASRTQGSIQIPERGKLMIEPIRSLDGLDVDLFHAGRIAERTFRMIVEEYRPGDPFRSKMQNEWKHLREVPEIVVETKMLEVV
jgi:hypothetical protein